MSKKLKLVDNSQMQIKNLPSKATIASSMIASSIIKMMESENTKLQSCAKDMYDDVFDSLTFSAQASFNLNMKRVSILLKIKSYLLVIHKIHKHTDSNTKLLCCILSCV